MDMFHEMSWAGRAFKDCLFPIPLPQAGTPTTTDCSAASCLSWGIARVEAPTASLGNLFEYPQLHREGLI